MAAKHKISCYCTHVMMQHGCLKPPAASVALSVVLSMVALLVLQQCVPTSSAAATEVNNNTATNSHATVVIAPPADLSAPMRLRPLQQSYPAPETRHRHRMLRQQPTNVSGDGINAAALHTQHDDRSCVVKDQSNSHARCKKSKACLELCARSPPDPRDSTCVCCRPGYFARKNGSQHA